MITLIKLIWGNTNIEKKNYTRKWKENLEKVHSDRIPKAVLNYNPKGKEAEDGYERDGLRPKQAF